MCNYVVGWHSENPHWGLRIKNPQRMYSIFVVIHRNNWELLCEDFFILNPQWGFSEKNPLIKKKIYTFSYIIVISYSYRQKFYREIQCLNFQFQFYYVLLNNDHKVLKYSKPFKILWGNGLRIEDLSILMYWGFLRHDYMNMISQ